MWKKSKALSSQGRYPQLPHQVIQKFADNKRTLSDSWFFNRNSIRHATSRATTIWVTKKQKIQKNPTNANTKTPIKVQDHAQQLIRIYHQSGSIFRYRGGFLVHGIWKFFKNRTLVHSFNFENNFQHPKSNSQPKHTLTTDLSSPKTSISSPTIHSNVNTLNHKLAFNLDPPTSSQKKKNLPSYPYLRYPLYLYFF